MLNIYLARHGQDVDNANSILNGRRDTPLTMVGKRQAVNLSKKIKKINVKFSKIYTSPLKRAFETAKIIKCSTKCQCLVLLNDLIEREFGIMTGQPHHKIRELCPCDFLETETVTYFLSPKGAETFPQLIARANKLLTYFKDNHQDENILLVTHGDFGKMLYCSYYNLSWKEVLKMFHFGNSDLLLMSPNFDATSSHLYTQKQYNL